MKWYEKLGKVGMAAAQGYQAASPIGAAAGLGIGLLAKRKKKNNLIGGTSGAMGEDPGGEASGGIKRWEDNENDNLYL